MNSRSMLRVFLALAVAVSGLTALSLQPQTAHTQDNDGDIIPVFECWVHEGAPSTWDTSGT